jgi:hypothetical protein
VLWASDAFLAALPAAQLAGEWVPHSSSSLVGSFVFLLVFWWACVFLLFFGDLALFCTLHPLRTG